ncbi:MAG TPA: hypothetical protein VKA68_05950 [bacterium]|nr:hypothetical protein [bacterium]
MRSYCFILLMLGCGSLVITGNLHAADSIFPIDDDNTQFSLGVNNLPWNANQVAFRWWNEVESNINTIFGKSD